MIKALTKIILYFALILNFTSCQKCNTSYINIFKIDWITSSELQSEYYGLDRLKHFYNKLKLLEQAKINKVRILQFGDSHTACDFLSGEIRRLLSDRFGSGGPGFIYIGKPWRWYYHTVVDSEEKNFIKTTFHYKGNNNNKLNKNIKVWKHYRALYSQNHKGFNFSYGLGGVCSIGKGENSDLTINLKNSYFTYLEFWYLKYFNSGNLELFTSESDKPINIPTINRYITLGRHIQEFKTPQSKVTLKLTNDKPVALFGFVLENANKGIVLDTLGLDGAKFTDLLNQNWSKSLEQHVRWRNPDLIIIAYGTNSVYNSMLSPRLYEREFRRLIRKIKKVTNYKCDIIILGPPDTNHPTLAQKNKSQLDESLWFTPEKLHEIIKAQISVAKSERVTFINQYAIMGGDQSMHNFVINGLAVEDHIHLKQIGYQKIAQRVLEIILKNYR
ncbi:MAG: hypothetical protein OEV44_05095 [Spirochaetota bacterium]|nr:hypothetical protein [Spirochaetota bacterium]